MLSFVRFVLGGGVSFCRGLVCFLVVLFVFGGVDGWFVVLECFFVCMSCVGWVGVGVVMFVALGAACCLWLLFIFFFLWGGVFVCMGFGFFVGLSVWSVFVSG